MGFEDLKCVITKREVCVIKKKEVCVEGCAPLSWIMRGEKGNLKDVVGSIGIVSY